ncbi:hypothetical protein ACFC0W_20920, partial [Actinacidiphila glaucinigra]
METFAGIAQRRHATGEIEYRPAVDPEGMPAGNPGPEPAAYHGTARGARPGWENRRTALSVLQELTLDVDSHVPLVTAPTLVARGRGDTAIPVADAVAVHAALPGPKELPVLDTVDHIGLYDDDTYVEPVGEAAVAFFGTHLGAQPAGEAGRTAWAVSSNALTQPSAGGAPTQRRSPSSAGRCPHAALSNRPSSPLRGRLSALRCT